MLTFKNNESRVPELHYFIFKIMTAFREHSSFVAGWFPPTAYKENTESRMPAEPSPLDAVTLISYLTNK